MSERKPSLQPTTKSERLPSLKPKRDLTLGGVKKKVYTPTVPPRRQKKPTNESKDDGAGPSSQDNGESSSSIKGSKDHSRKDGKDMGKGRGSRRKKDVITASSVFSMGPGERIMQSRKEMATFGQMSSRTSSETNVKPDRQGVQGQSSTEGKHQLLESNEVEPTLNDVNVFLNSIIPPIKLPLDTTSHRLPANNNTSELLHEVVVKQEPTDNDGEEKMEADIPPVVSINGRGQQRSEAADVFTPSKDGRGKFLLFQFPDCLPITSGSSEGSEDNMEKLSLRNVPEGAIGKIRVHSSGKVKLVLGDIVFDVTMGTRGGFLQELSSIRVDPPSLTILGQLSHKLVCVPDISAMLYGDDDIR